MVVTVQKITLAVNLQKTIYRLYKIAVKSVKNGRNYVFFHFVDGATLWLLQYKNNVSCELAEDHLPSVQNCCEIG